ncbi:PIR Superfamily Protein [Plasmodium ovale wallikeri]|uniref:PIR Superfamily Protein n=1 Tax=Plasmodium ovale wallikeri TaxID=864142 RepID=A0A1A9AHM5_PLAOA|nr:PIR Superfamily Protein [Plasmodium ovale wallikeri]
MEYTEVYEEAIKKYPTDSTIFCKALKSFKEKYELINNQELLTNCKQTSLLVMPIYKDPAREVRTLQRQLEPMEEAHYLA